jgi:hypothetical protein
VPNLEGFFAANAARIQRLLTAPALPLGLRAAGDNAHAPKTADLDIGTPIGL